MSLIDNQQPKIIIKWLFNYSQWPITEPELQPYIRLLNTINEREKITNLVYLSDKLASLTGRLMLYKLISMILLELEKKKRVEGDDKTLLELWKKIEIEYSKDGKPKVSEKLIKEYPSLINLRFNIAHHGDYSILIAGYRIHLGVDVMQIKLVQNEISEMNFISDFEGEFSKREWNEIIKHHSKSKHYTSLNRFMEYWCLKEALLKGIGIGLQLPLNEIDFNLNEKPAKQNLIKLKG
ncbi:hypothetical protein K502DRAFT_327056 [Neoconidiobolus thromboides FSU 785]|nr:hypothetical protein K502DRAFT_327056 [Neoconidiobolus thromboides FSU 785]